MPPKSQTLREANNQDKKSVIPEEVYQIPAYNPGDTIKIKEVHCCNDFIALVRFRILDKNSPIELPGDAAFKNEGMIVGRGPGLPGTDGKRCPSQFQLGDVIAFHGRPTLELSPKSGLYANQKVVIVSERSAICKLQQVPFEIVAEPKATSDEKP